MQAQHCQMQAQHRQMEDQHRQMQDQLRSMLSGATRGKRDSVDEPVQSGLSRRTSSKCSINDLGLSDLVTSVLEELG